MNRISRWLLLSLLLAVCLQVMPALAGQWEVHQSFDYYFPEDAFWDDALGGEVKFIYWQQPALGVAFAAGLSQWDASGQQAALVPNPQAFPQFQAWQGDMQFVPLGASLLLRQHYTSRDFGECQISLEAGCRYMTCNSELEYVQTALVPRNPGGQIQEVVTIYDADCDDAIVGRLAGTLAIPMNDQSTLFVGGGYQFDIDSGNVSVNRLDRSMSLDLSAFFAQIGLAFFLK